MCTRIPLANYWLWLSTANIKQKGESFKPKYIKLLSAGGSESPAKVLAEAGIDFHQKSFWQGGFDVLSDLVSQLEKLAQTKSLIATYKRPIYNYIAEEYPCILRLKALSA